jgi:hypothetical protein
MSFRISFLIVRRPRTLGILVAMGPMHGKPRTAITDFRISLHTLRYHLAHCSVHIKHVKIDPAYLRVEITPDRGTSRHVCFHNVANDLDRITILQYRRILLRLLDDLVPLTSNVNR